MTDPTVAVVGPGAIGATFAAVARRAGVRDLALCGRTRVERITVREDDGDAVVLDGDGGAVRTDPDTVAGPVDWLLLAVKAHQTRGAEHWLRALAGPGTVVVVLQNGVEHHERVAPFVDGATVLPAVVWCPAEPLGRETVRLRGEPALTVPDQPEGHRLAELLTPGGARVDRAADFRTELWRKLIMNAVAGLTVLTGRRAGMFRRPDVHRLAGALARECVAVATAEGALLTEADADAITDRFVAMPPDLGSSILFDRVAGRALEWDARNGVVQRFGARHGVPTPISDVLVPLLAAASDDPN
ncbi:MAG: oxidoreductase [Pseudonocardia sp.]|nr:oxidoreductase [Pseudonocardia sp.]MBO0873057.1 oxidoreductase [Pseudonocardia sp.]